MVSKAKITIEALRKGSNEYLIKDSLELNIGRVIILNADSENKVCYLRFKFYKNEKRDLLKNALDELLKKIFEVERFYKLNILVSEDTPLGPFLNVGLELQGILEDNLIINGGHRGELLFGINFFEYRIKGRKAPLVSLIGENIEVRSLTPENAQEMLDYFIRNERYLQAFEPKRDSSFYSYETQYNILVEGYRQLLDGTGVDLGIFKNNKLIGKIRVSNIVYGVFKSAIIGYSIDEKEQGNGYMQEAVRLVTEYSFGDLGLHRIEASAMVDNIKSQRVLLGCGFKELGTNEKYLYINGEWKDHKTFYIINNSTVDYY
ncbi:GNAT family N-acetyltransferase [Clostridium sp. 'White wine YQ']|uniref:GNAT family N-acetyltransferase n=1 Tax=Clostridium sp. 'White wine YQ' TaxID=3027474 RepID=UPI00236625E9|nr:GNAT family protein [Clostridium sp. 'White wine YQ']MDD7796217.1 GNAT family protein [Clostridium sp. 'White wine YQ']